MSEGVARYSKRTWAESDVISYLNSNSIGEGAKLLSNDVRAVYLLENDPSRWERVSSLPVRLSEAWRRWYSLSEDLMDSTYLIWFYDKHFGVYEYGATELAELAGLELAAVHKDGLVLKGNSANFTRASLDMIAGAEPVIDSGYQVYHVGRMLVYVMKPAKVEKVEYDVSRIGNVLTYSRGPGCRSAAEPVPGFFLHLYPVNENDLVHGRKQFGFDNLDFSFHGRAQVRSDGRCVVLIDLPEYDIDRIITGQFERRGSRYYKFWTKYIFGDDRISYTRCPPPSGYSSKGFFLHVYPVHGSDLQPGRERFGFNKRRLDFQESSFYVDGWCMHLAPLPSFEARFIRTGQLGPGGIVWSGGFNPARG